MRKKRFVTNVFIMSASMLIIRIAGMASNIYISSRAGAQSMGIYHMIFSIFAFGITFAASGTGFAVTRLASEGRLNHLSIIKRCLFISMTASFAAFVFFFAGAPYISAKFIKDPGSTQALRILAFGLPCMGVSSVIRGYFIAKRRAAVITLSSLCEEAVCILSTIALLRSGFVTRSYMCLIWGCVLSNAAAFLFDTIAMRSVIKKDMCPARGCTFRDIFVILIPIALGSYLRCALVTLENLMIPMQFEKFGTPEPVAEYGVIKAMAMPILLFPTVFVQAFSSMLVPELSEMNAVGRPNGIRHVSAVSIETVNLFSFFIALMLFKHHDIIAESFFDDFRVSGYLGFLSLLAIPMYLDTVADSILKGLNLQNASLKYNIVDSVIRVCAIFVLMPRFGPVFYVAMLYISEIFNLSLSLGKAVRITGMKINFRRALLAPMLAFGIGMMFSQPIWQMIAYAGTYFCIKSSGSAS